jgi:hypothetical protein
VRLLGHNSKAVHHASSKQDEVTVPSLDDWKRNGGKFTTQRATKVAASGFPVGAGCHRAIELANHIRTHHLWCELERIIELIRWRNLQFQIA